MSSEELRRLEHLGRIRARLEPLRGQLEKLGQEDFWHLDEAQRVLVEMLANPGHTNFHHLAFSLEWHLKFLWAEYAQLKGIPSSLPEEDAE